MTRNDRSVDSLWYDDDVGVYRFDYDADTDDLVVELVLALAEVRGVDPMEIPPIAPRIDPDRLEACVASLNGDNPKVEGKVTFSVADCDVTVLTGQVVIAAPREGTDESSDAERRVE